MPISTSRLATSLAASCMAAAALSQAPAAAAQPAPPPIAPPSGEYAPPPPDAETPGAIYDRQAQAYDYEYAERYTDWATRYCVGQQREQQKNATTGAVIGGVLGAIIGSNAAGHHNRTEGAIAGGALGAIAGAAIGSNATNTDACPPGYAVRTGAPAFAYPPSPYGATVIVGPSWYRPWAWSGDHWVYRPYRYWYWENRAYWRPDYRPGDWRYGYRRW